MKKRGALLVSIALFLLVALSAGAFAVLDEGLDSTMVTGAITIGPQIGGVYWYYWAIIGAVLCLSAFYFYTSSQETILNVEDKRALATIRSHALQYMKLGRTPRDIKRDLLVAGHRRDLIKKVVSNVELYHYILTHLKQGQPPTKIYDHLINHGWDRKLVKIMMNRAVLKLAERRGRIHPGPVEPVEEKKSVFQRLPSIGRLHFVAEEFASGRRPAFFLDSDGSFSPPVAVPAKRISDVPILKKPETKKKIFQRLKPKSKTQFPIRTEPTWPAVTSKGQLHVVKEDVDSSSRAAFFLESKEPSRFIPQPPLIESPKKKRGERKKKRHKKSEPFAARDGRLRMVHEHAGGSGNRAALFLEPKQPTAAYPASAPPGVAQAQPTNYGKFNAASVTDGPGSNPALFLDTPRVKKRTL